jgi:hypothetical protein
MAAFDGMVRICALNARSPTRLDADDVFEA